MRRGEVALWVLFTTVVLGLPVTAALVTKRPVAALRLTAE